ncbi:MAG: hypothetical protein LRY71_11200 [Bacillaceae bacterium]|nr:hypothetical protein [Bacillaceae bacterium]
MKRIIPLQVSDEFRDEYYSLFYELSAEAFEAAKRDAGVKRYMTKKEACNYIGVSFNYFQKLEQLGLPTIEIDGKTLVDREDISKFLNKYKRSLSEIS